METTKLNLASLKDKVSNALSKKNEKNNNKTGKKNTKSDTKKENNQHNHNSKASDTQPKKKSSTNEEREILRREALDLGATEDDLKLIEDVEENGSEEEFDDDSAKNVKELKNDLSNFMKSIGLETHRAEDVVTEEEDEEVEESVSKSASESESESEPESESESESEPEPEEKEQIPELVEEKDEEPAIPSKAVMKEEKKAKNADKVLNLQTVISDRLAVQPRSDWYNAEADMTNITADRYLKPQDIDALYEKAKNLIYEENKIYDEEFNKSSSQKRFLSQILTGGTLSDKISALTLLVQEAPLHNLKALDNLFNMCQKKSRTAAMQCVDAVVDLLVNNILPSDRKLKSFKKQPLSMNLSDEQLILMYFEDHLKTLYFQFISLLEKLSHDSILYVRMKIVSHIFALLKAKPEQEANLLRLGVNKLGDIDNKVSSKASYQILLLEQEHPAMKQIVCESVIDVVFRSNNDHHALYYSINTLNQTILTKRDENLANKLVDAYFALFEKLLVKTNDQNVGKLKESEHQTEGRRKKNIKRGKKGGKSVKNVKDEAEIVEEKNSKMFAAILTGLNRSFPFSNFPMNIFENHLNVLYKITHSLNFNTSVQALILIQTITNKFSDDKHKDRYFRTLYESLWDERLLTSSKQGIYLNLIYKSLKDDSCVDRVLAFVKRICQVCLSWLNIGTVAGMIFLLIQLEREIPQIRNLFLNTPMDDVLNKKAEQEESLEDDSENTSAIFEVYDSKKRDPKYAHADKSSLWELEYFLNHYHPTVQSYAQNFLRFDELNKNERKLINKPDLGLYTLSHFLDRFVYKKAKDKANLKGSSIMQPLGGAHTGNLLVRATGVESRDIPANLEDWLTKKADQVRPEDEFFYQYFSSKQEKIMRSKFDKEMDKKARDDYDEDSELDDDTVWNALVKSNPDVEGDDDLEDDLSDLNMSDFSDLDDEDDEEVAAGDLQDLIAKEGEDGDSEEEEEEEGLVRLKTLDDLEFEADSDAESEEIAKDDLNESSDGEDIKALIDDEDDDEFDSEEIEDMDSSDSEEARKSTFKNSKKQVSKKRNVEEDETKSNKKIKFSTLPTFASAEDYAQYLSSSDEE